MAISKVKLPDNSTQDIHDSRVAGIDSTPTSGSDNMVTSGGVATAIEGALPRIYVGTCSTAAATAAKVATVEEFPLDSNNKPLVGTTIAVKFSATSSSTNTTLNVNNTGAATIYFNTGVNTTASSNACGYAGRHAFYVWDGTYWVWISHGTDANDNYYDRTSSPYERRCIYSSTTPLYRYKICGYNGGKIVPLTITNQTDATIVGKTPTTVGIDPNRGLVYYGTSTAITSVSSYISSLYNEMPMSTCVYTFNTDISTYKEVYLKGTIKEDGLFYLDTTTKYSWYVQAPTNSTERAYYDVFEQGCYYMYVGPSYSSANSLQLKTNNPVFLFIDKLVPYQEVNDTLREKAVFSKRVSAPIKNDSGTINALYGNTISWNQMSATSSHTATRDNSSGTAMVYQSSGCSFDTTRLTSVDHVFIIEISMTPGSNYNVEGGTYLYGYQNNVATVLTSTQLKNLTETTVFKYRGNYKAGSYIPTTQYFYFGVDAGDYLDVTINSFQAYDLTLMFGIGNEPTIKEFEKMFPYGPYSQNIGALASFVATGFKTTDANNNVLSNKSLDITTLTGKLNGTGSSVTIFPNGLCSAYNVSDEIKGNQAIKRVGRVDLGSYTWTAATFSTGLFLAALSGGKQGGSYSAKTYSNVFCSRYTNATNTQGYNATVDKSVSLAFWNGQNKIQMVDTSYSDAASFKTAMNGVYLYYELATPEVYTIDSPVLPLEFDRVAGGYEILLPEQTSSSVPTSPIICDIEYGASCGGEVTEHPIEIITIEGDPTELETVPAGTYNTILEAASNGKYVVLFNKPYPNFDSYTIYIPDNYPLGDDEFYFYTLSGSLRNNITITSGDEIYLDQVWYEESKHKVTSLSSSSTDTQYPSAKCVYDELAGIADLIGDIDTVLDNIINGQSS